MRVFQLARLTRRLRELRPQTVWILDKTVRPALAAFLARVPQRFGMGIRRQRLLITNPGLDPSYDEYTRSSAWSRCSNRSVFRWKRPSRT